MYNKGKKGGGFSMRHDIKQALDKNKEINKFFTTMGFKKNYERVEKYLSGDEEVLYARNGNVRMDFSGELKESGFSIKDKSPVIFLVTDKRLLVYYRVLMDEKLEQVPISEIRSYDFKRNSMSTSVFRISSLTKTMDLDLTCHAKEVKYLNSVLDDAMNKSKEDKSKDVDNSSEEVIKIIKKLAELKEEGAITEEEFQQKKSKLLSKI